jgi:hypothetical protein
VSRPSRRTRGGLAPSVRSGPERLTAVRGPGHPGAYRDDCSNARLLPVDSSREPSAAQHAYSRDTACRRQQRPQPTSCAEHVTQLIVAAAPVAGYEAWTARRLLSTGGHRPYRLPGGRRTSQLNRDTRPAKITVLLGVLTGQPAVSFHTGDRISRRTLLLKLSAGLSIAALSPVEIDEIGGFSSKWSAAGSVGFLGNLAEPLHLSEYWPWR